MRAAYAVYRNDNTTSCPGWMVVDAHGRDYQWFPVDKWGSGVLDEDSWLGAYDVTKRAADRVVANLNAGGARRELERRRKEQ